MSNPADAPRTPRVLCIRCQHHYITWDERFPYGCQLLGFKSRRPPCLEVYASSGQECLYFAPRPPPSATG
ncbi:hypothetical protein [Chitinimonas sp. BJYL2]|uniref:hypothetical protein n=1 Tax=Chitinimonas sp. BJYL2 TaxID=2976696 RepID=UPI0022B5256F|nr:hypothetical protein [Chitinimonas sp. BJYL2]